MKFKLLKISVFVIILAFYASFLVIHISLTWMDNDAGLYINDGKIIWETKDVFKHNYYSFVEPDYPFVNARWLSSVVFYLVTEATGFGGLTIFKTLVLLSAFVLLFLAALKKANFWLVALFSLPTILILAGRNRIRPEMFSYLFIALFLYLLFDAEKHPERKRIFWLIPLQLLWVNFHIFFFLGIVLTAGFLLEKVISNYKNLTSNPLIKKLVLILVFLIAVCFINPNGIAGALAPIVSRSYASFTVSENQPLFNFKASFLSWDLTGSPFVPMVLIFLFSLFFGFKKKNSFLILAGVGSAAVGLTAIRLISLFALIFLPATSGNFNDVFSKAKIYLKKKWPKPAMGLGYILIIVIAGAFPYMVFSMDNSSTEKGYMSDRGIGLDRHSNDAATFFKEQDLKGPIFDDYDIGGYILYHLFPKEKVFVDNNGADTYPASFFDDIYMPALMDDQKWAETQEKYKLNAIFISQRDASPVIGTFLWDRLHDPSWALVYADTYAVIFLKNTAENQSIITKFQITKENIGEKIGYMLEDEPTDRMVASRLFYLIGREDLAMSNLKKVVGKYPKNAWVWLYMGSLKVMKNDVPSLISALVFLENAINMGQKTAEGYTWLGLAYFRAGQFDKAQTSLQKALWLEPGRYDTLNYLNQLQPYLRP